LIARIETFVRDDLAISALVMQRRALGDSVRALRSLLAPLALTERLRGTKHRGPPSTGRLQLTAENVFASPHMVWTLAGGNAAWRIAATVAPAAQSLQRSPEQAAAAAVTKWTGAVSTAHSTSGAVEASVTVVATPPPGSASLPAGGAASSAGGGMGASAFAVALLGLAAVLLLRALLPGRLPLSLFPWQSAILTSRLERPG
jgi:hypothetical protein